MGQKQSALTPQEISDMHSLTRFKSEDIIAFHQDFVKKYPKGRLTKDDIKKLYKSAYPDGNPDCVADEMFRVYDSDNNGTIDFREFLSGLGLMANGCQEDKLRLAFEMYDADCSGWISITEVHNLVQAMYKATSYGNYDQKEAEEIGRTLFTKLDRNKDNRVSLQEFIDGVKQDPTILHMLESVNIVKQ